MLPRERVMPRASKRQSPGSGSGDGSSFFAIAIVIAIVAVLGYLLLFRRIASDPPQQPAAPAAPASTMQQTIVVDEISLDNRIVKVPVQIEIVSPDDALVASTKPCCGALISSVVNPAFKKCDSLACSITACGQDRAEPEYFMHL